MVFSVSSSTRCLRLAVQALFVFALACAPRLAFAQTTVTLDVPGSEVTADTTIRDGGYASVNYSQSDSLESKVTVASYNRRILFNFDTKNSIPAGAVINSAKLYLTLKEADDSTSRPFAVYRLKNSFSGHETTWYDRWTGSRWAASGGDYAEKYTTTYVGNAVGSTYAFDVTQLVQRVVNGEFESRYTRMALRDVGGSSKGSYRRFHSTRSTSTALRPKLVISYGGASSQPQSSTEPVTSGSTGTTLRVMQWNIHKTTGTDGRCNADRTASWLAKLGAQIISMNEVLYYGGTCSPNADQGATLEALIEQKTGQVWYRKYLNSGKTGNLILSRLPLVSAATRLLSYGRTAVQVGVIVNGRTVNVFSTHVDYANSSYRTIQTNEVKNWAANFAAPRIVMGDFNTNPGSGDYNIMANAFADAWADAKRAGTATAYNGTGNTHGGSRFDYVYHTRNSVLVLKSVNVASTNTNGVYASDHDPVIAVYQVQ